MGSSTKSGTQGPDFPLTAINGITRRGRRRNLHTADTIGANLEQLCSARLICHDLKATTLDMQRPQKEYGLKPTTNYY
jgi:hypothetical protein